MFRSLLFALVAVVHTPLWSLEVTEPYLFSVNGANGVSISGNSTNSTGLLIQNTISGGHSYSLFSSGGGPSALGGFGLYDNTVGVRRWIVNADGSFVIGSDPLGSEALRVGGQIRSGTLVSTSVVLGIRNRDDQWVGISGSSTYDTSVARVEIIGKSHPSVPNEVAVWSGTTRFRDIHGGSETAVIIGADPQGSGLLRVGGGADIKGTVRTKEVVVTLTGWADHVLAPAYALPPLPEVKAGIRERGHLTGIPSEAEVLEKGVPLGDMQRMQLAKIEELTLYAISADEQITDVRRENEALRMRLARIEALLAEMSGK